MRTLILSTLLISISYGPVHAQRALELAVFDVDVTPPVGTAMAYDPVKRVEEMTLRARGIVLRGADQPIVLCAVDWIGIANEGHDAFREALAAAADTTMQRVSVHTLHQHDAPGCDFLAERLIRDAGRRNFGRYEGTFHRTVIKRAAAAVKSSLGNAQPITHYGWGVAKVEKVASNRRIMGPDGKVRAVRYTTARDPKMRAEPEGVIDPEVSLLSFWNGERPVAVLSYYACHPQSYYRTGVPSPDFPGIARFIRGQTVPSALHVHFNGAGGNIGAGKYNDGNKENRMTLALRLADGMKRAWNGMTKQKLTAGDVNWTSLPVKLPLSHHLKEDALRETLATSKPRGEVIPGAGELAWLLRCKAEHEIDIGCLHVGQTRILHMPGELFVEYQLAAKSMRPDLNVAMAAYGDYGPSYIGTQIAYSQGGYETSPRGSNVAPNVEGVLMGAIKRLLEVKQ